MQKFGLKSGTNYITENALMVIRASKIDSLLFPIDIYLLMSL